jgi:hypothetical protein
MAGTSPCLRNRAESRGPGSAPAIYVNDRAAAKRAGLDVDALALGPESFHLRTVGRDLHILGGGPRGVLYGVYELLETLGCRWFAPEVERIPRRRRIDLPPTRQTGGPAFEFRDMWVWDGSDPVWWTRNRMNGWYTPVPGYIGGHIDYGLFVHTFYTLLPPERFFGRHPEYFSLVNGARRRDRAQLCLTNPQVLDLVVRRLREVVREKPKARIFSVSQNDCAGYCECPRCAAVAQEEGSQSGPILRFVNAVAERTSRRHPDLLIDTLAYWYSLDASRRAVPHPNVRVRLTDGFLHTTGS